jgi:hypothetical protein
MVQFHKIGKRIAKASKVGSRVAQRSLKIGRRVAQGGSAAAALAGRPDVAMALGAAGEGMGAASKIIHHTHNQIKSDLEKPATKPANTAGEG